MGANIETPKRISDIVEDINKTFYLPDIQRGYEWKSENIFNLFDSLLCGYPIGTFMFWEVDGRTAKANGIKFLEFVKNNNVEEYVPCRDIKDDKKYSVEAKARQPFKNENAGLSNQLYEALKKRAKHDKIVFIDLNIPRLLIKIDDINQELECKGKTMTTDGNPAPEAYVFITNCGFVYDLEGYNFEFAGFVTGFKKSDFKLKMEYSSIRESLTVRKKHQDMTSLLNSVKEYDEIPQTFDGEIPEYVFDKDKNKNRLIIGNKYLININNKDEEVVLEDAIVLENSKQIYGFYKLSNGELINGIILITEDDLKIYKKYPDIFFGVEKKRGKTAKDPLGLFDFFIMYIENVHAKNCFTF